MNGLYFDNLEFDIFDAGDPQHRWRRSKQIFGGAKDFCPNFPKLARKVFVRLLPKSFLPQKSWRPFFDVTSKKKVFSVFLLTLGAILARSFRDFAQMFKDFSTNQNLWGYTCIPAPASHTTGPQFHFITSVPRAGRSPYVHWHLSGNLFASTLISVLITLAINLHTEPNVRSG